MYAQLKVSTQITGLVQGKDFIVNDSEFGKVKVLDFDVKRLKLQEGVGVTLQGEAFVYQAEYQGLGGYFYPGRCSKVAL